MASTLVHGPKMNPYCKDSKIAEGALVARSFVKTGTTDDQVIPIATTDNEPATGYVDQPWASGDLVDVWVDGNVVDVIADGTVAAGDFVQTGDAVGSVKTTTTGNIVGRAVGGNTTGKTIQIRLGFSLGLS